MSDQDRAPNPRSERAPMRERRRTIIVGTGERGGGGSGGGAMALILLLIVVGGLAWFLMRSGTAANVGVNVSLSKEVNPKVPEATVKSDRSSANASP